MQFYAFIPREDGSAPMGSEGQTIFSLKTIRGAVERCNRVLGSTFVLYACTNIYDEKTYRFIHGKGLTEKQWEAHPIK